MANSQQKADTHKYANYSFIYASRGNEKHSPVRLEGSKLSALLPLAILARGCLLRESMYRLLLIEFTEKLFWETRHFKNHLLETGQFFTLTGPTTFTDLLTIVTIPDHHSEMHFLRP